MLNNNITRWIVGILIVVSLCISFYSSYQFSSAMNEFSERTQELTEQIAGGDYSEQEERIEGNLEEMYGYEVFSVFIHNYSANHSFFEEYNIKDDTICGQGEKYCKTNKVDVLMSMKSLGSRSIQIDNALLSSSVVYPNAFTYSMIILSPTDTCNYFIFGDTYKEYTKEIKRCFPENENRSFSLNEECFNSDGSQKEETRIRFEELRGKIETEIEKYKICS